jgi:hypothetical protein
MRAVLILLASLAAGGCKTAEFVVDHSMTGIHVAAKFEAKDAHRESPSDEQAHWNGGDAIATLRR